jgi:hypothetical protein
MSRARVIVEESVVRLPLPTKFLALRWNIDSRRQRFGERLVHLLPPTSPDDLAPAPEVNIGRTGRRRFVTPTSRCRLGSLTSGQLCRTRR